MSQDQYTQGFASDFNSSTRTGINNIPRSKSKVIKPKGEFLYNDILWKVLPENDQQNRKMMKRIFENVDRVSVLSSRFLAVRYDLHLKEFQTNNQVIELFHKHLFAQLRKHYPKSFVSYIWVRERNEADAQHYHYALMMDGDYIRTPYRLNEIVKMCWEAAAGGTVYFPENMAYFVKPNDVDTYSKLMIRLSYFGKKATKEPSAVCKKRIGFGIRKPRKESTNSSKTKAKTHETLKPATVQQVKPECRDVSAIVEPDLVIGVSGKLDQYFNSNEPLESLKPSAKAIKFSLFNQWFASAHPDWKWHRLNYVYEVISAGIHLSEYATKYSLNRIRVYANFRQVGGQSLRIIHWAWHRRNHQLSCMSVNDYVKEYNFDSKTAVRQLRRREMSDYWSYHFDHYYQQYWPQGYTVASYCRKYNLNVSTARRYLVDFPPTGLINPFVLKPWL